MVAHHWTDKGFRELLEVLEDMFAEGNPIPRTTYEAKKIVCPMGLKFKKIHACKNDCILFHGAMQRSLNAPKCGTSHYKQRTNEADDGEQTRRRVPRKVAWYFSIIPRLKCLFATSKDARLLS
jgi:hypothetical protein